ncbi:hypothetical protein [Paenibacillus sp. FSL R10-2748]|uniref:hypothetical protein n=1 Tax=Paenibacillus sp. FSL R10-2748 TaxID=2954658 RepID=UPI0030F4C89E
MNQICENFTNGMCQKRKCEVNLFLNDFINKVYKTGLQDIGFECLDISGEEGAKPEISFILEGKKTVIEAKTLVNSEINTVVSFTEKIAELIEKNRGKNRTTNKSISKKKSEIKGVRLTLDETILSLAPLLCDKNNKAEQEDLTHRILTVAYNKTKNMRKRNEEYGSIILDISKYKRLRYKDQKKVKRTLYNRPSLDNWEDTYLSENEFLKHSYKTEEYIQTSEKKITIAIQLIDSSDEIEIASSVLNSTFSTPTVHLKRMIEEAEEKFQKCDGVDKKILFFNNDFYRLLGSEIDDGYNELICEIRDNVKSKNIDEVWIEYIVARCASDDFDCITAVSEGKKGYERIYPIQENL